MQTNLIRCELQRLTGKLHCAEHYPKALKLYRNYKNKSQQSEEVASIKEDCADIKKWHDAYVVHKRAYDARKLHQQYAIAPDCVDEGHQHQFWILLKRIQTCESFLVKLYNEQHHKQEENEKREEIQKEEEEEEVIMKDVHAFVQRRKKDLDDEKVMFDKYEKANRSGVIETQHYQTTFHHMLTYFVKYDIEFAQNYCMLFCLILGTMSSLVGINYFKQGFVRMQFKNQPLVLKMQIPSRERSLKGLSRLVVREVQALISLFEPHMNEIRDMFYPHSNFWNQKDLDVDQYFCYLCFDHNNKAFIIYLNRGLKSSKKLSKCYRQ